MICLQDHEQFYGQKNGVGEQLKKSIYTHDPELLKTIQDYEDPSLEELKKKLEEFNPENATFEFSSKFKTNKNEQFCINYGNANNRYWIIEYGFALLNNKTDMFAVHVDVPNGQSDSQVVFLFHNKESTELTDLARQKLAKANKDDSSKREASDA